MTNDTPELNRRRFLAGAAAAGAAAAAAACTSSGSRDEAASGHSAESSTTPTSDSTASTTPTRTSFVSAGPRTKPLVALTFHVSGDRDLAVTLLDLLQQHHTPITAFMVGTFVEQNPDLVRRFVSDGHEVANHTFTHPTFASLTRQQMSDEVTRCRDALTAAAGESGRFFRASGTANGIEPPSTVELDVAMTAGYPTMLGYDVDPADYADPGAPAVVARVATTVQPGSIVSLHFGHQGTIDALPHVLDTLAARSLVPVTASTLLSA